MILIFGGAFQGKLDYAREHWNFNVWPLIFLKRLFTDWRNFALPVSVKTRTRKAFSKCMTNH